VKKVDRARARTGSVETAIRSIAAAASKSSPSRTSRTADNGCPPRSVVGLVMARYTGPVCRLCRLKHQVVPEGRALLHHEVPRPENRPQMRAFPPGMHVVHVNARVRST